MLVVVREAPLLERRLSSWEVYLPAVRTVSTSHHRLLIHLHSQPTLQNNKPNTAHIQIYLHTHQPYSTNQTKRKHVPTGLHTPLYSRHLGHGQGAHCVLPHCWKGKGWRCYLGAGFSVLCSANRKRRTKGRLDAVCGDL